MLDSSIDAHGGRIVRAIFECVLAEFPFAVDALHCAMAIQTGLAARDAGFKLRIAVNVGDFVIEGDTIRGDGVIIALRLGSLTKPGEVAISGAVHDDIAGQIDGTFRDSGQSNLKGIDGPINIWRWSP